MRNGLTTKPGHSGYLKNLGQVIRVFRNSGFQQCYLMFVPKQHYLNFRVPDILGSGLGSTLYTWNYKKISFNNILAALYNNKQQFLTTFLSEKYTSNKQWFFL
jgi:hypothetical protein